MKAINKVVSVGLSLSCVTVACASPDAVAQHINGKAPLPEVPPPALLGDWSPAAAGVDSLRKRGQISNNSGEGIKELPSPQGCKNGDYWVTFLVGGGAIDLSVGRMYPGDLAVCLNQRWVIQAAPSSGKFSRRPLPGDYWNVSASGYFDGHAYSIGDRIVFYGGSYYHFFLPDKFKYYNGPIYPGLYWIGDSMTGFIMGEAKKVIDNSYYGFFSSAGSGEVASIFDYESAVGVANRKNVVVWIGQNSENRPLETAFALKKISSISARNAQNVIVVTPVGRREFSFNGVRLVGKWQEEMNIDLDKSNGMVATQDIIKDNFVRNYVDARKEIISAVLKNKNIFSKPDIQFPGMTEFEVAKNYGIVPLSMYQDINKFGVSDDLDFAGYWKNYGVPDKMINNSYYIRVGGNGFIGSIIVCQNGHIKEIALGDRNLVVHLMGPNASIANIAISEAVKKLVI